eukprot:CAMPEP_0195293408 /NCGR_PEP_ID=MMETSP0707-20130614/12366_1 /TAXON_ID=33640 /ORGANISM="Asterionellopsis glacialis, Strain CCMP134" /LENGTH=265 /DNA_ID=CAMNT_0040354109 /DNA_START=40 /DNA_END=837 /DNA_ORIENTATION=+
MKYALFVTTLVFADISSSSSFQQPAALLGRGTTKSTQLPYNNQKAAFLAQNAGNNAIRPRQTSRKMNKNDNALLYYDELESQGEEAAENWDVAVTPFLSSEDATQLQNRLDKRADVGYVRIGSDFTTEESSLSSRTRFVMSNPDIGLDASTASKEYCATLRIDNVESAVLRGTSPWPHVLTRIGVDIESVGDVVVVTDGGSMTAYLVVVPEVARQCTRLLPKELKGMGITVSIVDPEDYLPYYSGDGLLQDMELSRLDKRALQYK